MYFFFLNQANSTWKKLFGYVVHFFELEFELKLESDKPNLKKKMQYNQITLSVCYFSKSFIKKKKKEILPYRKAAAGMAVK